MFAAAVGGAGIGSVCAIYADLNDDTMPSSTFNRWVHPGIIVAALGYRAFAGETTHFESADATPLVRLIASGLLVGSGAKLGDGCTSGNGIQGLASFSPASLAFVVIFMVAGAATSSSAGSSAFLDPIAGTVAADTPFDSSLAIAAFGTIAAQLIAGKALRAPYLSNLLAGVGFGLSLIVSGMVKPSKVLGFLDFSNDARGWDPSLALVMGGALLVATPIFQYNAYVAKQTPKKRPSAIDIFAARPIDAKLLIGGAFFGAGWGGGGLCPGPAIVAAGVGTVPAMWWVAAMFTGREIAGRFMEATPGGARDKAL